MTEPATCRDAMLADLERIARELCLKDGYACDAKWDDGLPGWRHYERKAWDRMFDTRPT